MDVLSHALLPVLVLLAASVPLRRALFAVPFAVALDLDILWGPHRATFHNVFVVALLAVGVYWVARRALGRPDARPLALLATFGGLSHLVLDLPHGVALLYPLTLASPYVSPQLFVDFSQGPLALVPAFQSGWLPAPPTFHEPMTRLVRAEGGLVTVVVNWAVLLALLQGAAFALFHPRPLAAVAARFRRARSEVEV